ncbi:MAG: FliA/WhiG family RNA polymerase sigma factor [Oscillospiraceae bacterium]
MYTSLDQSEIIALIKKYQENKDIEIRNKIVMEYSYIAKTIAIQMRGIYSQYAQLDDIVNQGIVTLIECVDKFDISKEVKFETYASLRIRGTIIDYVRKQDWVPRRVRKNTKDVEEVYTALSNRLMREPTTKELAEGLGISEKQLDKIMSENQGAAMMSFEGVLQDIQMYFMKNSEVCDEDDPERKILKTELHKVLKETIRSLNEKEQLVISLYYYEELKLADIADILGLSQSRICQIHTKAIKKMKSAMKEYMEG